MFYSVHIIVYLIRRDLLSFIDILYHEFVLKSTKISK